MPNGPEVLNAISPLRALSYLLNIFKQINNNNIVLPSFGPLVDFRLRNVWGNPLINAADEQRKLTSDRRIEGNPSGPELIKKPKANMAERLGHFLNLKFDLINSDGGSQLKSHLTEIFCGR